MKEFVWSSDEEEEEKAKPFAAPESPSSDEDEVVVEQNRVLSGMVLQIDEPSPGETLMSKDDANSRGDSRWRTKRRRIQRCHRQRQQMQELQEKLKASEENLQTRWETCLRQNTRPTKEKGDGEKLKILKTCEPEGPNSVTYDIWEQIVMYVDSGATETVLTERSYA